MRKDISSFFGMHKVKVVFIKELRQKKEADRSTLHVRLQIDQNVDIWPACNVEVFPINKVASTTDDQLIVTSNEVKGKVPYPPMPLKEIKQVVNFNQNATNNQLTTHKTASRMQPTNIMQPEQAENKQNKKQKAIKQQTDQYIAGNQTANRTRSRRLPNKRKGNLDV